MPPRPAPPRRAGFTLVEILLVVVIVGISSAVAFPLFARSIRGARLRLSGRTVVMMHRNAQSRAVLGSCYAALFFDDRKNTIELFTQADSAANKDAFFDTLGGPAPSSADASADAPSATPQTQLLRPLEDTVRIDSFSGGDDIDGIHVVQYYPSGMCQKYSLVLADDEGRRLSIEVDPVTGKATVSQ